MLSKTKYTFTPLQFGYNLTAKMVMIRLWNNHLRFGHSLTEKIIIIYNYVITIYEI